MIDPREPDFRNSPCAPGRPVFGYLPDDPAAEPRVSVLTPYFNTRDVFRETAASVLQQSFQQWEWIIVNDGSTDEAALAVLGEYRSCDHRIRVLDLPRNEGPSGARNVGWRAARSPFVLLLDSDDLLEPTAMEKWFLHLVAFPRHAFVKGLGVGFGEQRYVWDKGFHSGDKFLEENLVDTTSLIRHEVLEQVGGFDESMRGGLEDWDFWLKCAAHGLWGATIPEYLNWYRRRADHTDRWSNLEPSAREKARALFRTRYPRLWEGEFPTLQTPEQPGFRPISEEMPADNLLRKTRRRLLMVLPWMAMGGADKFNLDVVRELAKREWDITVVTTKEGDHAWLPEFARLTPDVFPLSHIVRGHDFLRVLAYLVRSRRPDVVFLSNSDLGYRLLPYLRSRFPETTFIDYCHMEEEEWNSGGYPWMSVQLQEQLDLTIVSSHHLHQWMRGRGGDAARIEVCTTNIDTDLWAPDPAVRARERARLSIPERMPVIFSSGRIVAQKQPFVLLETLHILKTEGTSFMTVIAGDGPDLEAVKSKAAEWNLLPQIVFMGELSNAQVHDLMVMADLFFLPSKWEGISLAMYEAMAAGLAVVGADVGGQAELVVPGSGILVQPSAPAEEARAYAAQIGRLIAHPDELDALKMAARTRVTGGFRIGQMGDRMHALLKHAGRLHQNDPRPGVSPGLGWSTALTAIDMLQNGPDRWWYKGVTDTVHVLLQAVQRHIRQGEQVEAETLLRTTRGIFSKLKEHDTVHQIDVQLSQFDAMTETTHEAHPVQVDDTLVTVVIPCYRQARFLREAMESVVVQSYPRWEMIVVNDGSPDDTSAVVQAFAAKHPSRPIRLIEQDNRGLSAARNAGCAEARGDLLVPLDADDRIAPTFIERCSQELHQNPGIGFIYTHMRRFGEINDVYELPEFSAHSIVHEDNTASVCALMRKRMWKDVGGYNESMREGYEDWDFWVGCIEKGWKGLRVPEPLFEYRVRAASMIHEANARRSRLIARIVQNHPGLYGDRTRAWATQELGTEGQSRRQNEPAPRRPLRVTYLIHSIEGVTGGNQTLLHQANALAARGHDVTLVTYSEPPVWMPVEARAIRVPVEMPLSRGVPTSDVVVATYFLNALELVGVEAPVKVYFAQGDQFVFDDSHVSVTDAHEGVNRMREMSRASYLLHGVRLVVNSHTLQQRIHSLTGRDVDGLVPVCVDKETFHPAPKEPSDQSPRVLVVGPDTAGSAMEPLTFKGIGDIRVALDILVRRGIRFTTVRISNTPREIFRDVPCEFHQAPDPALKTRLFGTADILVYASHYDSCPRPPLEAMASGAAVVCTATDGALEYCRDGQNALLVPVGDPTRLAQAVERLLLDVKLRERLVQGGAETARLRPVEREQNEWEDLLQRFVHDAASTAPTVDPQAVEGSVPDVSIVVVSDAGTSADMRAWATEASASCGVSCELLFAAPRGDTGEVWTASVNPLMISARAATLCIVRAGLVVTEGWLARLIEPLRDPGTAIVAPLHTEVPDDGPPDRTMTAYERRNRHRRLPLARLTRDCFVFRRDLLSCAGLFSEHAERAGEEPELFRYRVALAGYEAVCAGDVVIQGKSLPAGPAALPPPLSPLDPLERAKREVLLAMREATADHLAGNTDRAVARIEQSLALIPESPTLAAARASMLLQTGQCERVSSLLGSTPDSVKRNPRWLEFAGFAMHGLGEQALAQQCAEKALALNARCAGALMLRGMLFLDDGRTAEAEQAFRDAIAADPSAGESYAHLGAISWGRRDREEGYRLIEQAFVLSPTIPVVLGSFREAVGERENAVEALPLVEDALLSYPESKSLTFLHAELLVAAGKAREALNAALRALARFGLDDALLDVAFMLRSHVGPLTPASPDAVSLCMIVRDEEDALARCLMSARPLVGEIVIVDTGSSDRTPLIATAFGARVITAEWHDDFSAARNVALGNATGAWALVLDADEQIGVQDLPAFQALRDALRAEPAGVVFTTRNYVQRSDAQGWQSNDGKATEQAGTGWIPSDKVRLFPLRPGVEFAQPVHETVEASLESSGIPVRRSDIPIHHYGRMNAARTRAKAERYAAIGRRKVDEGGGDPRAVMELAAQEQELGRHEEAAEHWRTYLDHDPSHARAMLGLGVSLAALRRLEEARDILAHAAAVDPALREAPVKCALVCLQMGDVQEALTMLQAARESFPEYPYVHAANAVALACAGRESDAAAADGDLRRSGVVALTFYHDIVRDLQSAGQEEYARRIEYSLHLFESATS